MVCGGFLSKQWIGTRGAKGFFRFFFFDLQRVGAGRVERRKVRRQLQRKQIRKRRCRQRHRGVSLQMCTARLFSHGGAESERKSRHSWKGGQDNAAQRQSAIPIPASHKGETLERPSNDSGTERHKSTTRGHRKVARKARTRAAP